MFISNRVGLNVPSLGSLHDVDNANDARSQLKVRHRITQWIPRYPNRELQYTAMFDDYSQVEVASDQANLINLVMAFDAATGRKYEFGHTRLAPIGGKIRTNVVYVFSKNDHWPMGWLAVSDWTDAGSSPKYGLYSRNYFNGRYHNGYRRNMAMSQNINTLVKKAVGCFRPLSVSQIVDMTIRSFSHLSRAIKRTQDYERSNLRSDITRDEDLLPELIAMMKSAELGHSHVFRSSELQKKILGWIAYLEEQEVLNAKKVISYVQELPSEEQVLVARLAFDAEHWNYGIPDAYHINPDDLPEGLVAGMAVLNMMPTEEYVPFVGVRFSADNSGMDSINAYYVVHEEEL